MSRALLSLLVVVAALSCAPATTMTAVWKDPALDAVTLQRPLVVFQHESEALRRSVEDALAARIPRAVASYRVLPTADVFDIERLRTLVEHSGFDALLVGRMLDVETEIEAVGPGGYSAYGLYGLYGLYGPYGPMWGGWGPGWTGAWAPYAPMALDETTVVSLETLVYTLAPRGGDLVWAAHSETFDPRNAQDLADSLVRSSVRAMEERGVAIATAPAATPERAMGR